MKRITSVAAVLTVSIALSITASSMLPAGAVGGSGEAALTKTAKRPGVP